MGVINLTAGGALSTRREQNRNTENQGKTRVGNPGQCRCRRVTPGVAVKVERQGEDGRRWARVRRSGGEGAVLQQ